MHTLYIATYQCADGDEYTLQISADLDRSEAGVYSRLDGQNDYWRLTPIQTADGGHSIERIARLLDEDAVIFTFRDGSELETVGYGKGWNLRPTVIA